MFLNILFYFKVGVNIDREMTCEGEMVGSFVIYGGEGLF